MIDRSPSSPKARTISAIIAEGQAVSDKGRTVSLAVRQNKANRRKTDLSSIIADIQAGRALSLPAVAAELNSRGIPTARGGRWSTTQVMRILGKGVTA